MKRFTLTWLAVLGLASPAAAQSLAGLWDATVTVNKLEIPFRFEIAGSGPSTSGTLFNGDEKLTSTSGSLENGTLTPSVRAEYRHNTQGSSDSSISYADLPPMPFGLTGGQVTGGSAVLGLETEFEFAGGPTVALGGDVRVGTSGRVSKSVSFYLGGEF